MYITVREVLGFDCLQKSRLLAGEEGLDREIRYIDVIEVPDVASWLKEGGFYLTTGYSIKDDISAQLKLVESMVAKRAAALGIKFGRYLEEIPGKVISYCNQHCLPIISIPKEIPYLDISVPILTAILHRQAYLLQQGEKIHQELTRVFLKGGKQKEIAEALYGLMEKPVIIQDCRQKILIQVGAEDLQEEIKVDIANPIENLASRFCQDYRPIRIAESEGAIPRYIAPVIIYQRIFGYVSILETDPMLHDVDIKALEQASVVLALEMLKEKEKGEVANRLKGELLDDLVNGKYDSPLVIIRRGHYLGWNLTKSYFILYVDIDNFEDFILTNKDEVRIQSIKDIIKDTANHTISYYNREAILVNKNDSLVVLLSYRPEESQDERVEFAKKIKKSIETELPQFIISVGIGNFYPHINGLKQSYHEALQAITIGRDVFGQGQIYHYNQLGVYRLLVTLQENKNLRDYYYEVLGPILNVENDEMLMTICSMFRNFGNKSRAAKELCIHRNSLRYRLQKLERLLGVDLDDPEQWLELFIAAKIGQVLSKTT